MGPGPGHVGKPQGCAGMGRVCGFLGAQTACSKAAPEYNGNLNDPSTGAGQFSTAFYLSGFCLVVLVWF